MQLSRYLHTIQLKHIERAGEKMKSTKLDMTQSCQQLEQSLKKKNKNKKCFEINRQSNGLDFDTSIGSDGERARATNDRRRTQKRQQFLALLAEVSLYWLALVR